MDNEQASSGQDWGKGGGACEKCGCNGKWHHKQWKRHGGRGGMCGGMWFVGWLFTIGFLKLAFWKGLLALIVWPYFLGVFFAR
jgi:hypothetical protein